MHAMERINRRTWKSTLRFYARTSGYTDPGEEAALNAIQKEISGGRILDLGVGGGRTAEMFAPLAGEYVGVDYTPEMVSLARSRFPELRFAEADARDLHDFKPASFDLVAFSCNGIDSVDPESRAKVLKESARVLRPGGLLFYSTFNRDGPGFRTKTSIRKIEPSANPLRLSYSLAKYAVGGAIGWARVMKNRRLESKGEDCSILLHGAHDFGILVHAISLTSIPRELAAAGFRTDIRMFGASGAETNPVAGRNEEYVHVIARRT